MTILVKVSMDYIIWMLNNPDKLTELEKEWIDEFTKLLKESLYEKQEIRKAQEV